MKKTIIVLFLIAVLLMQIVAVSALTESDAKQAWMDAKQVSKENQQIYKDAKIEFAGDKSEVNKQKVVDSGKEALRAALDEAQAWLIWKDLEVKGNPDVPDDLKSTINQDVTANLAKIGDLRKDVDGISNQLQLGIIYLKMVGKYVELLTDVARDSGKIYVHLANSYIDKADDFESKLRTEAGKIDNNAVIIYKLDKAKADIAEARSNVIKAESSYEQVVMPGAPLIKFAQGNSYLRVAKTNILSAQSNLNQVYDLILRG